MAPPLRAVVSELFYDGRLEDGACILLSEFVNLGEGEQVLEFVGRFNINFDNLRKNEVYL